MVVTEIGVLSTHACGSSSESLYSNDCLALVSTQAILEASSGRIPSIPPKPVVSEETVTSDPADVAWAEGLGEVETKSEHTSSSRLPIDNRSFNDSKNLRIPARSFAADADKNPPSRGMNHVAAGSTRDPRTPSAEPPVDTRDPWVQTSDSPVDDSRDPWGPTSGSSDPWDNPRSGKTVQTESSGDASSLSYRHLAPSVTHQMAASSRVPSYEVRRERRQRIRQRADSDDAASVTHRKTQAV